MGRINDPDGTDIQADKESRFNTNEQKNSSLTQSQVKMAATGYEPGQQSGSDKIRGGKLGGNGLLGHILKNLASGGNHQKLSNAKSLGTQTEAVKDKTRSVHGNTDDLGQSGNACQGFGNAILAKRNHSLINGQVLHLLSRCSLHD